jgi:alpha-L-fucosidase
MFVGVRARHGRATLCGILPEDCLPMRRFRATHIVILSLLAAGAQAGPLPKPDRGGVPDSKLYDYGIMGPPATPAIVAAADAAVSTPIPAGPFRPDWESVRQNYRVPGWFQDTKFGIFMHWGVYAVPAHHNEWYEKHMYGADLAWHTATFGPPERFGYKDFIPKFTQEKFDAAQWASLFRRAGAQLVMPSAQHHDNFALWNSKVAPYNTVRMGPKRDLIGELAGAVRNEGMKLGLSNHGIENFTFINPPAELEEKMKAAKVDLYDPQWAGFYNVADRSPAAMTRFLTDWVDRNLELIDQYQPDLLWFDNGVNLRVLDPLKLRVAAYYYNRAKSWNKDVTIGAKYVAYAPSNDDTQQVGAVIDFEKIGVRSPAGIRPGAWMVDDVIGSTWGYTEGMQIASAAMLVGRLVDTVSKGGLFMLNLSPRADGTIPEEQQKPLLEIGKWLGVNGEAIYGTRPWIRYGEAGWHFTVKGSALYAIGSSREGGAVIAALGPAAGKVARVEQLGKAGTLKFSQGPAGLVVQGASAADDMPLVLKISGLLR